MMLSRRRLFSLLPGAIAGAVVASRALAQQPYELPPPPTLTMEQVSREIATLKVQVAVGLSILKTINLEIRKINGRLGNPGPHPERARRT